MRPWPEWAERQYLLGGTVAHLLPYGEHQYALCRLSGTEEDWFGTGDWSEIETAASLPLCTNCERNTREH